MEELIARINAIYPISQGLSEFLDRTLKVQVIPRKGYLLKAGQTSNNIGFIQRGLLRCFYYQNKNDISSWFMKEGDMVISVESFFKQTQSFESIQALEECELYYIEYAELQYMYRNYYESNFIGRVLTENYYTLSEQRVNYMRMTRALEKYEAFEKSFPDFMQRVPLKHIATYIGVTVETLSRIRSGTN